MADRRRLVQLRALDQLACARTLAAQGVWGEQVRAQHEAEQAAEAALQATVDALAAWQDSLAQGACGLAPMFGRELLDRERAATGARIALDAARRETDSAQAEWQARDAARQGGERQLHREQRRAARTAERRHEQRVEEGSATAWFRR